MSGTTEVNLEKGFRLDWNDVRVFLAVGQTGSLSAAGRLLGMLPSTVSRRVEDLEGRLGAQLIRRSTTGVVLTEAGTWLVEQTASMARTMGAAERALRDMDRQKGGRVGLAAPDGVAAYVLMPQLVEFRRQHPDIELSLDCGLWPESPLLVDTDFSLDFQEQGPGDVVSMPIATIHYAFFASPGYIQEFGSPRSLAELADHRLVTHVGHRRQRSAWPGQAKALDELIRHRFETNSSAAMYVAMQQGAGVGCVPTYMSVYSRQELVMLDLPPLAGVKLWLRHHRAVARTGRAREVKRWLEGVFDPGPNPWFRDDFIHPDQFGQAARAAARGLAGLG